MGALKVFVLISCVCLVSSEVTSRDVVTDQGTVRGYNDDNQDVFGYYGIPYATAPRGEDKFKAALPPPTWDGVFNATTRDIICPQSQFNSDSVRTFNRTIDCLIINVFAPKTQETKLPVFVYIYGGGFQNGYGLNFNPIDYAAKGVVAVNFNYRTGAHGFLCLGTEFAPGNAGLKDQSAALKWVQRNIAQFGGDPDNVMIAGGSAGSISVELQVVTPMSRGLFHKAALESGSATASNAVNMAPLATAETYAKSYGGNPGQDVQQLEEFYKNRTDEQLNEGWISVGPDMGFIACLETHDIDGVEKFLESTPIEIIKSGNYEKRPLISGFGSMEGLGFVQQYDSIKPTMEDDFESFLPSNLKFASNSERLDVAQKVKDYYFPGGNITYDGFIKFYTDSVFTYPHVTSARLHAANSVPVYILLWTFSNGTINLPDVYNSPVWGPGHIIESLYLMEFDNPAIYRNITDEDLLVRERLRELYLNFQKYSKPVPSKTQILNADWLPETTTADTYLDFNLVTSTATQAPLKERLSFWEDIYKQYGLYTQTSS